MITIIKKLFPLTPLIIAILTLSACISEKDLNTPENSQHYQPKGGLVLNLGDFEVFALIDDEQSIDADLNFMGMADYLTRFTSKDHRHLLTPEGKVLMAMGGHLIRNKLNNRLVLVDAGMGDEGVPLQNFVMDAAMLKELAAVGYKPEDITDVVFTHLHADHSGWAATSGKPTFPNATYWCHQAEWDHWVTHTPEDDDWMKSSSFLVKYLMVSLAKEFALPIEPWLKTYQGDSMELFPGLTLRHAPGHTPGSTIVQLESHGKKALLLGDVVALPVDLLDKDWYEIHFDTNSAQTIATRNAVIDEIAKDNIPVAGNHFSGMQFGHLRTTEDGYRFYFNEVP